MATEKRRERPGKRRKGRKGAGMGRIVITMNLDPEFADEGHEMGVTEAGYEQIVDMLGCIGDDIDVRQA